MRAGSTDDWVVLSNRLLLLQEIMVGLNQLPPAEVVQRAAEGVTWVFDGGALHTLKPEELSPRPLITRGRTRLEGRSEVYLAYFAGPPEPLYLALSGVFLTDPQEFRLAALYFEHLLAALAAAGYREELARQARTDWLTGLANRRALARLLPRPPNPGEVVGVLEAHPLALPAAATPTQADHDIFLKQLAETLVQALPEGGRAFRTGAARVALVLPQEQREELGRALARAGFEVSVGWARPRGPGRESSREGGTETGTEIEAATFAPLFEEAEARLERELAARGLSLPAPAAGRASAVRVACGSEPLCSAMQARAAWWPVTGEVQLILDTPHGFALTFLAAEPTHRARTLVVTDSPSQPYLRDLRAQEPEGLIVGSPADDALVAALERVLSGERFYGGPPLADDGLYPREREVWRLVVRGLTNAQIAEALKLSEKTVANYVTSLQDKLFLRNRVELVLFYLGKLGPSE
jgi:DNA-binding CsgD family transcriptional regulator/GGDEF domain-containing protein